MANEVQKMPNKNALRKVSESGSQLGESLTRKASDIFKRTVSKVIPSIRDRKSSKTGYSKIEDPPGLVTDTESATKAHSSASEAALLPKRNEVTSTSDNPFKDNESIPSIEQFNQVDHEDLWERQRSSAGQRPALQALSPNQQHTDAIVQVPTASEPYRGTKKRFYEEADIEDRLSLHDDIFGNESSGSVLRTIRSDEPSPSQTELGTDTLAQEFPITATIEITQQAMPCFDSSIKATGAMWLLVDMKCVSIFGDNSRAAALCPGILENLSVDFHMPTGYEVITYCGAVQQRLMTAGTLNNVWSIAICICRSKEPKSLSSRVTSTVSSTVGMIDGFLKALRADNPNQPKTAVLYRITGHQGSPSRDNMLVVKRFCNIPRHVEKRATGIQQLDEARALITRAQEGNDDEGSFAALHNDFRRWRMSHNASMTARVSSLVPRPLFGTEKGRGGKE